MNSMSTTAEGTSVSLEPRAWRNTRWVGAMAGHISSAGLLAGAHVRADQQRAITRSYAAACADLAQATLGGATRGSAKWDRWFADLRAAAHSLSHAREGQQQVVERALFHGARLEGAHPGSASPSLDLPSKAIGLLPPQT